MSNDLFGLPQSKPSRASDPIKRPVPLAPDLQAGEPWFVGVEESKNPKYSAKRIINKLVQIIFPLFGIAVIGFVVAGVIMYALGMYE